MKQYYYCAHTEKYVMYNDGFYSLEKGGVLKPNRYYDPILIGELWAYEISEEEFYKQLNKSLTDST